MTRLTVELAVGALAALVLPGCAPEPPELPAQPDGRPIVAVSIAPQAYLIERMTGGLVDVRVLVAPGRSPEDFQPLPRDLAALAGASHFFSIGLPVETVWLPRLADLQPAMRIVPMHAPDGAGGDPHVWTDPQAAMAMARAAYDVIIDVFPGPEALIFGNYLALIQELTLLDQRIAALLDDRTQRRFLVYHPAWGHFAARYGLQQVAVEQDGKEPSAQRLTTLVQLCRDNSVDTLFVQPQSATGLAQRFAKEIGATLQVADPLRPDYPANLLAVANAIAGALW